MNKKSFSGKKVSRHSEPQQEIDQVHSLTLGKIIRLNTDFKSAPDNVFFSSLYCAGVDNFQCVHHKRIETDSCDSLQQELSAIRKSLAKQGKVRGRDSSVTEKQNQNEALIVGLIVVCVLMFLAAVVLFILFLHVWCRWRRGDRVTTRETHSMKWQTPGKREAEVHNNDAFL